MNERIAILGTGLIGASLGLALKAHGFQGTILGWDSKPEESAIALERGALDWVFPSRESVLERGSADIYVLATPVLAILDWMDKLATVTHRGQLITDVGSTKAEIGALARERFGGPGQADFLPGHPMAGKESGGSALADALLFRGATWLFTPEPASDSPLSIRWRELVAGMGAHIVDMGDVEHDRTCAWVSHLPQMLSTALAALLEDTFPHDAEGVAAVQAGYIRKIGGRALRETTRLGASPYSMWRDVALTNTEPIAQTLMALEQRLAHIRENLRTPELREEFEIANRFKKREP